MGQVDTGDALIVRGQGNRHVVFHVRPDGMPVAGYAQDGLAAGQVDLHQDALFGHALHELRCLRVIKNIGAVTDAPGAGEVQRRPDMPSQVFGRHQAQVNLSGMQRDAVLRRREMSRQFPDHFHLPAVVPESNGVVFRGHEVQAHVARVFFDEMVSQQGLRQHLRARERPDHLGQVADGHAATGVRVFLPAGQDCAPLLFNGVQLEDCRSRQRLDPGVTDQFRQGPAGVEFHAVRRQLPGLFHAPGLQQFQVDHVLASGAGARFGQHVAFAADARGDEAPER